MQPYRLALDLGSTSLGWVVLDLSREDKNGKIRAIGIRRLGVRIFSDGRSPKDKTSLAVARRVARQMRRRRDRYLVRRENLLSALVRLGLMPADPAARRALADALDPYELRARAVTPDGVLTPDEIGRALFHLNQRRGFQGNRRTDAKDQEQGKIKAGIRRLEARLEETDQPTLGAFMRYLLTEGQSVRARLRGTGAKAEYDIYPSRALLEREFAALWQAQAPHHPALLTEAARADLHHRIFHQRPLKPVKVGKCTFIPTDERAPRALPSAQRFRLLLELANLQVIFPDRTSRPLTLEERDRVVADIRAKTRRTITFKRIRQVLKLPSAIEFSHEDAKRPELLGDVTAALLANPKHIGPRWMTLPLAEQDALVDFLLTEPNEVRVIDELVARWGLDAEAAVRVAGLALPDFHLRIGRPALALLLKTMACGSAPGPDGRPRPLRYDEAVPIAFDGKSHSDLRPDGGLSELPYYGAVLERHVAFGTGEPRDSDEKRLGRIANPTVHIGLNQVRKLVNALIKVYGPPTEVVVELARDLKQSREQRLEDMREQATNQRKNEARRALIEQAGRPVNGRNIMKVRLWEEQGPINDRCCPYTGKTISLDRLLSDEVEIDHILPFSTTLDDSVANKVVAMRFANRAKRRQPPWEAFGSSPTLGGFTYDWPAILSRAATLPGAKKWRFAEDALARFDEEGGWEARQINDTRYLARIAREYLGHVCHPDKVRASPGRLTKMLRGKWGLDSILADHNREPPEDGAADTAAPKKNRDDHRHHALDAVVIGVTDQGMVQKLANAAKTAEERDLDRFLVDLDDPWDGFREAVAERIRGVVVSHKPEHAPDGRLHEDTAYGLIAHPDQEDGFNLVVRKPLAGLTEGEVVRIRAKDLREAVGKRLAALRDKGQDHKPAMESVAMAIGGEKPWAGIRRVRLRTKEANPIRLRDLAGCPYKALIAGDIHHTDIIANAEGRWTGRAMTLFEARRLADPKTGKLPPPVLAAGERLVMQLHKNDLVRLEHGGTERVMRVVKLEPSNDRVILAEHFEGGRLTERHKDAEDRFEWLNVCYEPMRKRRARRVTVDFLGRLRDPGPPKGPSGEG